MFKEKLFAFVQRAMDGHEGWNYFLARPFLLFFSFFFKAGVFCKNYLYDANILKPKKVRPFVISIGNIVAGGVGKTPFTIFLAEYFLKKQKKVAIISRGYGRKGKKSYVLCKKENKLLPAALVGDEPALIANRLDDIYVIVDKSKVKAAALAERLGSDIVILDDGFQHRKLHRDLDLVLVNEKMPEHFLPRGVLRDFPKRLKKADLVIVSNAKKNEFLNPFIYTRPIFSCLKDLNGKIVDFKGKKIGAFCALANPRFFIELLKISGFEIIVEHFGVDHGNFSEDMLEKLAKEAMQKGATALICSEKDFIKLYAVKTMLPIYYLEINIEIIFGKERLISVVSKCEKELL